MDSGLGSDEERRTSSSSNGGGSGGGRTTTKEQKQLHNQRLLSGCFIDASSLTDDGNDDVVAVVVGDERRRDAERRQGALIFQTSIPQYSMLQMSSDDDCFNFPVAPSPSASSVHPPPSSLPPPEPNTPFNSIVQLDEVTCKSPLGFYVDLNDVVAEAPPPPPPPSGGAARKNIFSMVIDFEAPKKDMPSRLSSSLIAKRKVRDKKSSSSNNSRSLSAASSSSSLIRNGFNNNNEEEVAIRNSSSSSLCSSGNNAEGNQSVSASVSDINDIVKEKEDAKVEEDGKAGEEDEVVLIVQFNEKDENARDEVPVEKESPPKEVENANCDTQVKKFFVCLLFVSSSWRRSFVFHVYLIYI